MRKTQLMLDTLTLSAFVIALGATTSPRAETTGQYIDDATIATKVRAAFVGDTMLQGSNISVETDKAAVYLTGLVTTKTQESEAVRVAGQVDGVKTVQDHITIRGTESQ